jgi:predicted ATPase
MKSGRLGMWHCASLIQVGWCKRAANTAQNAPCGGQLGMAMQEQAATPQVARWRVRTLGALEADDGRRRISRFPSRAVAALLARLALAPTRAHAREELIELLWPGVALHVGRNRLRQTLSTLRALLESPGEGEVLIADRAHLRVAPGALACDAPAFEAAQRRGDAAAASALYGGELLPGLHDEWVITERARLAALAEGLEGRRALPPAPAPLLATPPATSATSLPPLPRYLTRLFGVDDALRLLAAQVQAERLVSVVGPGGAGKTRLAVEAARMLLEGGRFFERVAFVPLVACHDVAQLRCAVAAALGATAGAAEALAETLAPVPTLLVLDNFEQLAAAAAAEVAAWLARCERLHLLVTTRRALGAEGEALFEIAPLALPAGREADPAHPALALFADRARAVRGDFRLDARNLEAVAALVRALDGLPLAIELAASRVRSLPVVQMLAAITAPQPAALDLLARGGPRSALDPRHASMRRTIEWSWRLLDTEAAALLAALTLFPGTFSAGAASALHGAGTRGALLALVEHSLVRLVVADGAEPRYALYEPVREFAAEHLAAQTEAAQHAAARTRLRHWLLGWARALPRSAPRALVEPELATLRALLRPSLADGAAPTVLAIVLALRPWWDCDGIAAADLADIEAVLGAVESEAMGAEARALCADAHELLAHLRFGSGSVELAAAHADAALRWAGAAPLQRARALVRRAWVDLAGYRLDTRWCGALEEALALAAAGGDRETEARALHQLAIIEQLVHRNLDRADALLERSMQLWQALGDRAKAMARWRSRAELLGERKRWREAIAVFVQCEAVAAADGDWVGLLDSALLHGLAACALREWETAAAAIARSAAVGLQRHHGHGLAYALWHQPWPLARLRRPEAAARLMAFAERFWLARVGHVGAPGRRHLRRVRRQVQAQLGHARTAALWAEGAALPLSAAADLVLLRAA